MYRTSEDPEAQDVSDHVDVSELIARIAAERGAVFEDTPRPRVAVGVGALTARIAAEREELEETWVGVDEITTRLAVERGEVEEDPHRHRLVDDRPRSRRRVLAPAIAGVTAVLVATTVALTLRAGAAPVAPAQNAALVGAASPTAPAPAPALAALPGLGAVVVPNQAAASAVAAVPRATRAVIATPTIAPPVVDDGTQAATANGWTLVDRDEFTTGLSPKWGPYDGKGNAGKGRRSPDAISVANGVATIRGDADGTTGGMAWADDRRTGRWEMRARFPKGDAQYHPVLLLWPGDGGSDDGEVDFAETTSAASSVSFFLHHRSGDQVSAKRQLDLTQWHDYAVEVTADRVTGYVDGQKWFESTDRSTLPQAAVHPVVQLDWFPKGDSPEPTELQVDWMRIYQ